MKHKIGIICAGEAEINPVLSYLTNEKTTEKAMLKFYEGQIEGIDVVALACGVCKVNAAIAAPILIDTFGCNVMINGGTCGGMDHGLHVFDKGGRSKRPKGGLWKDDDWRDFHRPGKAGRNQPDT